ncbi:hypothetical protein MA16_Dca019503 [Dendrobium catenatum]|uniref:Uncharacterized protein n=1 Tax=Dendrobium catenatum TaxID=906689 RepID=A0A2I0XJF6_9ASPA|nr:hypothetical protein MA16_Dca019503 [Dendrobium catenatum]
MDMLAMKDLTFILQQILQPIIYPTCFSLATVAHSHLTLLKGEPKLSERREKKKVNGNIYDSHHN